MPWYRTPDGHTVHLNFGRARNKTAPKPCCKCGWISVYLCDWKIGKNFTRSLSIDCDRPMCAAHAFEVGKDKHLCPFHVEQYRAWLTTQGIPLQ